MLLLLYFTHRSTQPLYNLDEFWIVGKNTLIQLRRMDVFIGLFIGLIVILLHV